MFISVLVAPKIKILGFGARGHVQKSQNHGSEEFEGSPISKSKKYKFKLKQNSITELLSIYFPQNYHNENGPNIEKKTKMRLFLVFWILN